MDGAFLCGGHSATSGPSRHMMPNGKQEAMGTAGKGSRRGALSSLGSRSRLPFLCLALGPPAELPGGEPRLQRTPARASRVSCSLSSGHSLTGVGQSCTCCRSWTPGNKENAGLLPRPGGLGCRQRSGCRHTNHSRLLPFSHSPSSGLTDRQRGDACRLLHAGLAPRSPGPLSPPPPPLAPGDEEAGEAGGCHRIGAPTGPVAGGG